MGLIDLKSNLSWYGEKPPQVNNLRDEDATGYTTGNNQVGGISEFQGISGQFTGTGLSYIHTGVQGLGLLNETNFFLNTDHRGFRSVRRPGDQSDYTGVNSITLRYTHTGNQGLGDLAIANSFGNDDAIGFSTLSRPLQDTEFQGVDSAQSLYIHTGVQGLGNIGSVNHFQNLNAIGFTNNRQQQADSEFIGVDNIQTGYAYTGTRGLGDLSRNLRPLDGLGNPERDTFVRGAIGNFTTRYTQTGGPTDQLGVLSATVRGFAFQGVTEITPLQKSAADAFPINSVTFSQQGVSSRAAQLGSGTKFPIGPVGQVHEFDIARTGFSGANRYGDIYGAQSNSGLADTYTAKSPIDDMYNKFKIRDEAHNPFSFPRTRHPLILRGIQKDDFSDPERYGIGSIPGSGLSTRAGITTETAIASEHRDRIGKYLISPEGLAYNLKQIGLQAMNPNVENEGGSAQKRGMPTQNYDPFSVVRNIGAISVLSGKRIDRHGTLLGLRPNRGKYEQIHKNRRNDPILDETENNRLVRLRTEYELGTPGGVVVSRLATGAGSIGATVSLPGNPANSGGRSTPFDAPAKGMISDILTSRGGPKSILGIGRTTFSRSEVTDVIYLSGNDAEHGYTNPSPALGNQFASILKSRLNNYDNPYVESGKSRSDMDEGAGISIAATDLENVNTATGRQAAANFGIASSAVRIYHDSLKKSVETNTMWLNNQAINKTLTEDARFRGGGVASSRKDVATDDITTTGNRDETVSENISNSWVAMSYEKLRNAAKARSENPSKLLNFQLLSRGEDISQATYDKGIILGDKLLRFDMYEKGKTTVKKSGDASADNEFEDLITFKIGSVHFEAYIDSISDSSSPGLASSNDSGVLLPRYRPESYSREISVEFKMIATNPDHLALKWEKMKKLMAISVPISGNGTVTTLTIGNLYNDLPVVCNNFECSWDGETNWEIHKDWQVPILTTCSLSFNVLTMRSSKFFAVNPQTALTNWTNDHKTHIGEA